MTTLTRTTDDNGFKTFVLETPARGDEIREVRWHEQRRIETGDHIGYIRLEMNEDEAILSGTGPEELLNDDQLWADIRKWEQSSI